MVTSSKPMPHTSPVTKDDLRSATKDIIERFNQSQGSQNLRLDSMDHRLDSIENGMNARFSSIETRLTGVETKLEAIMDMLATRKELLNLVRELKARGVAVDESKIFV